MSVATVAAKRSRKPSTTNHSPLGKPRPADGTSRRWPPLGPSPSTYRFVSSSVSNASPTGMRRSPPVAIDRESTSPRSRLLHQSPGASVSALPPGHRRHLPLLSRCPTRSVTGRNGLERSLDCAEVYPHLRDRDGQGGPSGPPSIVPNEHAVDRSRLLNTGRITCRLIPDKLAVDRYSAPNHGLLHGLMVV